MLSDCEILPPGGAVGGGGRGGGCPVGGSGNSGALPTLCWVRAESVATPWDSGKRGSG